MCKSENIKSTSEQKSSQYSSNGDNTGRLQEDHQQQQQQQQQQEEHEQLTKKKTLEVETCACTKSKMNETLMSSSSSSSNSSSTKSTLRTSSNRRGKRVKQSQLPLPQHHVAADTATTVTKKSKVKVKSSGISRHEGENMKSSGGIDALIPSIIALIVIGIGIVTKMGWRGRATTAGIDLGTTNSVICVQQQSQGSEVGKIDCIPDPINNSPIIPSVISFLDPKHYSKTKSYKKKEELGYNLDPSPSYVIVGSAAKNRINTHPHHTLYHAKRVLGRMFDDDAVKELAQEVEFDIIHDNNNNSSNNDNSDENDVSFHVPFHGRSLKSKSNELRTNINIKPHQVGSYIINHLMEITTTFLGHDNVKSAVIAVPAKFNPQQRAKTVQAFKDVGVNVARILEEPVAAALAYGLQKKDNVDYIIVYDFGGGTLDVSVLQVFDGGYVEVIGNDGDNRLGGADFDAAVAHYLLESNDGFGTDIVEKVMDSLRVISEETLKNEKNADDSGDDDHEDKSKDAMNELEEHLVSECPKLEGMPLCSLSSLHTLGEQMKIELSSYTDGDGAVSRECLGIDTRTAITAVPTQISDLCDMLKPIEFRITSKDYDIACEKLYERSLSPVSRILKDLDLAVDDIDEVVMVGGTTRMPQIREMVKKELQIESLNTSIDPDLTVAYGAASVID